ncbi:MAG: formylglycine-generating enzyme family protein [Bacteroidales bacterium]|nr:formylglycine-generating enzyme family protein [Bacteroidales bacterium]
MKEELPFVSRELELREDFTETALGLNMEMVYVEGGEFEMVAMEGIKLDGYHIGKYPVTQAQWEAVMGKVVKGKKPSYFRGDNRPVNNVNWFQAQEFCKKLSEQTGKKYVLPTEAQWEYAARGGNKSKHYKYAGSDDIDEVAWYRRNSGKLGSGHPDYGTHPVGMKKANELGIYDMSGNVWEWCSDWYMDRYDKEDDYNPQGPVTGFDRVHRGGGWNSHVEACHVSYRLSYPPRLCGSDLGFRVACISK